MGIARRFFLLGLVSLGLLSAAHPARAAESILRANTQVSVSKAGTATYVESLEYLFDGSKHGIYRDIPVTTRLPDGKYLNYTFDFKSVHRGGAVEPHELSVQGSMQRIKIGSANTTVSGTQQYEIEYGLSPVVRHDSAGDYLSINAIGTGWEVPIKQAQASVVLPAGTTIKQAVCYVGAQGSTEKDCEATVTGTTISVQATRSLSAKEGMTIDIVTPEDCFDAAAYQEPSSEAQASSEPGIAVVVGFFIFFFFAAFLVPIILLVKYLHYKKQQRYQQQLQTIVAQYTAPDGLTPGEVGLLVDNVAAMPEITATIIHLATRGHLKIGYEKKTGFLASGNTFTFTRLRPSDKLEGYEASLLDAMFVGTDTVEMSKLDKQKLSVAVSYIKEELKTRLQNKGYFAVKQKLWSAQNVTGEGYEEWAKVEGFKLYLNVAEKDRINFHEAPAKTPEHFSKLLPYAIALGVEKQWAAHFADMDISQATNWYVGDGQNMSAIGFTNLLSSSFATGVSSSFSPPSSSGGSGGGFSGGGSGGGGGGSW